MLKKNEAIELLVDRVGYQNHDARTGLITWTVAVTALAGWVIALVLTGTGSMAAVAAVVAAGTAWLAARLVTRACDRAYRRRRLAVIDLYSTARRSL